MEGKDGFMRKNKEFVLYILIILLISSDLWGQNAQPVIRPTVKTAFPVYTLTWNKDGSLFSYAEQGNIVIRKTSDYSISKVIETSSDEIFAIKYASSITDRSVVDRIVSVSTDNCLEGRALPDKPVVTFNEGSYYRRPTSLAISATGDYIATGMGDGSIELFMWYFTTNSFTRRTPLQTIGRYVYSVDFSRQNGYLAAATDSNSIFIFDVTSGIAIHTLPYNSDIKVGVQFTADSKGVITAVDETTLGIYNFDSELITEMNIKDQIRDFQLSKDGKQIFVLTRKNQIRLYNANSGKELGFITPFNNTEITSFAVSPNNKAILIGHRDGSIYLAKIDDVLLDPNAKAPKYSIGDGKSGNATNLSDVKKTQSVFVGVGPIYHTGTDFAFGAELDSGYINYDLIRPFYFGGTGTVSFAFASEDYPYNYYIGGDSLKPLLHTVHVVAPIGFIILPMQKNIELYAEINPGLSLNVLWDGKFGKKFAASKVYPSFFANFGIGLSVKRFNAAVYGEYDFLTGFSFKLSAGYLFNIAIKNNKGKK